MDRPSLRAGELTHPHVWPHISTYQVSLAHTHACTHGYTHIAPPPSWRWNLRFLDSAWMGGREKCLTGLTSEDPGAKKMSTARIQLRDMKQTKKSLSPPGLKSSLMSLFP